MERKQYNEEHIYQIVKDVLDLRWQADTSLDTKIIEFLVFILASFSLLYNLAQIPYSVKSFLLFAVGLCFMIYAFLLNLYIFSISLEKIKIPKIELKKLLTVKNTQKSLRDAEIRYEKIQNQLLKLNKLKGQNLYTTFWCLVIGFIFIMLSFFITL